MHPPNHISSVVCWSGVLLCLLAWQVSHSCSWSHHHFLLHWHQLLPHPQLMGTRVEHNKQALTNSSGCRRLRTGPQWSEHQPPVRPSLYRGHLGAKCDVCLRLKKLCRVPPLLAPSPSLLTNLIVSGACQININSHSEKPFLMKRTQAKMETFMNNFFFYVNLSPHFVIPQPAGFGEAVFSLYRLLTSQPSNYNIINIIRIAIGSDNKMLFQLKKSPSIFSLVLEQKLGLRKEGRKYSKWISSERICVRVCYCFFHKWGLNWWWGAFLPLTLVCFAVTLVWFWGSHY